MRDVPDLVVTLRSDKSSALPSESVILMAIISNAGVAGAASTTLRWYRSADTNLDKSSDTLLASNTVTSLGAGASITLSNTITTASTSSTNTYFACVDQVSNELDPADNCSSILLLAAPRGTWLPNLDFPSSLLTDAGVRNVHDMWSDGTTMWVLGSASRKLYAYSMSNKARNLTEDFNNITNAGNNSPQGIWSDGTNMWVGYSLRGTNSKIYAYKMSDKTYDSAKDFDTLNDAGNSNARGIWSDGTTMWVSDLTDDKLYAYKMSDKTRDSAKDFDTLNAENGDPTGIWSDGTIMWVMDINDRRIYAYKK